MSERLLVKLLLLAGGVIILSSLLLGLRSAHNFYASIFRLSFDQISSSIHQSTSPCKKISDCKVLPGDILIRRYITDRTLLFDRVVHPYFTHSAFYLGDDQIVEAIGTEKNPADEIRVTSLSKSDWQNEDIEAFVIIRPEYSSATLNVILSNLKNIAEDKDYRFGLPKLGYKRATCASLIANELLSERVLHSSNIPKMITPDYLFYLAVHNLTEFKIVGFTIHK